MGSETIDRRVRKTKKQLSQALTNLLLEKDIKSISVKELTSLADVNRGTFYLHYRDIYDLYKQIQNEIYVELHGIFEKHLKNNRRAGLLPVVSEAFAFFAKNRELCIVVLNSGDSDLLSRIIELGKPKSKEEWFSMLGNAQPELYEYYYSFITAGCVGLLRSWLTGGMVEPPAKMAELAGRMIDKAYTS
ncbi:MAG TPA: TetR/AcrR family transcriptional regulator [Bacillota bacterium]|jgi:AcrR family transcriptional regulator|nr:TetR/AcrR family transcriptional regulator [Bacillota bacterium]